MRRWIIDYFLGEPEEISEGQELLFYGIVIFLISAAVVPWIITM